MSRTIVPSGEYILVPYRGNHGQILRNESLKNKKDRCCSGREGVVLYRGKMVFCTGFFWGRFNIGRVMVFAAVLKVGEGRLVCERDLYRKTFRNWG